MRSFKPLPNLTSRWKPRRWLRGGGRPSRRVVNKWRRSLLSDGWRMETSVSFSRRQRQETDGLTFDSSQGEVAVSRHTSAMITAQHHVHTFVKESILISLSNGLGEGEGWCSLDHRLLKGDYPPNLLLLVFSYQATNLFSTLTHINRALILSLEHYFTKSLYQAHQQSGVFWTSDVIYRGHLAHFDLKWRFKGQQNTYFTNVLATEHQMRHVWNPNFVSLVDFIPSLSNLFCKTSP